MLKNYQIIERLLSEFLCCLMDMENGCVDHYGDVETTRAWQEKCYDGIVIVKDLIDDTLEREK